MEKPMNNKTRTRKQSAVLMVMNVVIVILCVGTFLCGIRLIREIRFASGEKYNAETMENFIRYDSYDILSQYYHINQVQNVKADANMKECYGVAKYYDAAVMYKAYETVGDENRAASEKQAMDAAYQEMGEWRITADTINKPLGIKD